MIFSGYGKSQHAVTAIKSVVATPVGTVVSHLQTNDTIPQITVDMGDVVMKIPKNYFMLLPTKGTDGKISFELLVQLPNFDPRTFQNEAMFERTGWHDQVSIFIEQKELPFSAKAYLDGFYKIGNHDLRQGPFGYQEFTYLPGGAYEYYFKGNLSAPNSATLCKPEHEINEIPGHWFPDCQRQLGLSENISVHYTLSRNYFSQLDTLQPRLIDFLNGFVIQGPKLQVME
jgi:hypothetical protein